MISIDTGPDGVVAISGRLDAAQSPAALAALERTAGQIVLDCGGLEYISSAGLGVLLKTQKRLMSGSGQLRLTKVNRHIRDIFKYSGFDNILQIESDN